MGRLIIAEKHSVAQAIAAALGGGKAEDGWIGCGADAVTWAQGHLVDLLTPDVDWLQCIRQSDEGRMT